MTTAIRVALPLLAALAATAAVAQPAFPPPGATSAPGNPVCQRLESQLASFDRGQGDQLARYESAASRQQSELDRLVAQSRRSGCEPGLFSIFGGQSQQCAQMNNQIQQMRGNLDQITGELQRLQSGSTGRQEQRRAVLLALAQNNCGPQYRSALQASQPRGIFGSISNAIQGEQTVQPDYPMGSGFRTVCVRTCDGYFFPISNSTSQSKFPEDENTCRQLCPAAETALYAFHYPGEDINHAVSVNGRRYTELPNAFRYRQEFNAACSCRATGQSWAEALKNIHDTTVERGDIVVTGNDGRPAPATSAAQRAAGATPATTAETPATPPPPAADNANRTIRNVGPTFLPKQ